MAAQPAFSRAGAAASPSPPPAFLVVGLPTSAPPKDPATLHRGLPVLPPIDLSPVLPDGSPDPAPVPGGRFRMMQTRWDNLIGDEYCSSVIRDGLVPEVTKQLPPRYPRPRPPRPGPPTAMQRAEVELIQALHQQRVLDALTDGIPPPDSSPCPVSLRMASVVHPWFSTYFLVPKPTTPVTFRGILDLRGVNEEVVTRSFKMDSLKTVKDILRPGDYMTSVDISSAYPHVPIARRFRNLLCMRASMAMSLSDPISTDPDLVRETVPHSFTGGSASTADSTVPTVPAVSPTSFRCQDFRFRCLPFGLKSAPRLWTRICKPVMSYLRRVHGIRLVIYLDDILICNQSRAGCHRDTQILVDVLRSLGFLLNAKKCATVPAQRREFLGLICDSTNMIFRVPPKKRRVFMHDSKAFLALARQGRVTLRLLARWLGKARSFADAVMYAKRRTRASLRLLNRSLNHGLHWDARVRVSSDITSEVRYWLQEASLWSGHGILIPQHDVTIDTDAGPWAWGGFLGPNFVQGFYTPWEQLNLSQNHKEMLGVFYTLQGFERLLWNKCVLVQTDNTSVMTYLGKGQGGRSNSLSLKAEEILDWCAARHIRLRCVHLAGILNIRADKVSRQYESRSEYKLRPAVFRSLERRWGRHDIDLFAARHNHQTPRYYSRQSDSAAAGGDAFLQDWTAHRNPYANPPFYLIPQVLRYIRTQRVPAMTLIVPDWGAAWLPDLQELAIDTPMTLPDCDAAPLMTSALPTPWPSKAPRWTTSAWRLSGTS